MGLMADLPEALTPARQRRVTNLPLSVRGCGVDSGPTKFVCADSHLPADAAWVFYNLFAILCPDRLMRSMIPERVDWHTRKVAGVAYLKHAESRSSVLMPLNEAIPHVRPTRDHEYGSGSQFTSLLGPDGLASNPASASQWRQRPVPSTISLSKRLCGSLKYECGYLHAWETGSEAKSGRQKVDRVLQTTKSALIPPLRQNHPLLIYWQRNETTNPISRCKE